MSKKMVCWPFRRCTISIGLLLVGVILPASTAHAQTRFTSLTTFGDSYFDHSANLYPLVKAYMSPAVFASLPSATQAMFNSYPLVYPNPGASLDTLRSTTGSYYVAMPYQLQPLLGLPDDKLYNYAIGGATTSATNGAVLSYGIRDSLSLPFELDALGSHPFGPRDLVAIHIGGNDAIATVTAGAPAAPGGTQAAANAVTAVQRLANLGARQILFMGFSDASFLPYLNLGYSIYLPTISPPKEAAQQFGAAYFAGLQQGLLPLAQSGVRIFLFDDFKFTQQVQANPAAYGLGSYLFKPGTTSLFVVDNIHLTTEGFALMARYAANILNAPSTFAPLGDAAHIATTSFGQSMFSQLDAGRSGGFGLQGAAMPLAPANPFSVYLAANGTIGQRDNQADALGMSYDVVGGQIGAEYRLNGHVKIGGLFNYGSGTFNLYNAGGSIDQNSYQFGGYASLSYPHWFTDVMALYSRSDLGVERPGLIDRISGDTRSDGFAAGIRSAYLFDVAPSVQIGPLAGVTYARTRVAGYTENGDPVLTYSVAGQSVDSLAGSAGVQIRFPFLVNGQTISPYVNLTAEHDFLGGGRTILARLTQSPLLPIYTPIAGRGGETYGGVQAGISTAVSEQATIALNVVATFARSDGNDVGGNLVVKYRF